MTPEATRLANEGKFQPISDKMAEYGRQELEKIKILE